MSWRYICPKCGRAHTTLEYRDSRFCRECGKFLTRQSRVRRSSIEERKVREEERSLFPYKPYPQQLEFMRDIGDVLGSRGVLVAEACNGFGKTICALASVLSMDRKIVYATRTHEQVRQVLLEVEHVNKSSRMVFSAVNLASRGHLCLNEKCKGLSAAEAVEACRLLKGTGKCPYKTEFELQNLALNPVLSIWRLRREGKTRRVCPYFLARKVAERSTVVVAPYQYIFNEYIRRMVKLELRNRVLVFDEAHNADQVGQDALSDALSERTLSSAKRELEAVEAATEFIDSLAELLDRKVSGNSPVESGTKFRSELRQLLGVEKLSLFAAEFSDLVDEIRTKKIEKGDNPVCFLNGVLTFLKRVDSSPGESYVTVYRTSFQGFNLVEYRCLDPSLAIKPVVEEASGALIMSGTLSPLELFAEVLGLKDAEKRAYSAIADPENVRTIIDSSVTSRFKERSREMIQRYGKNISRVAGKIPNGVLVFFPQRKFMLESLDCWQRIGIIDFVGNRALLNGKPIFIEGTRALENRKIVEEYKRVAKSEQGAVLCGVFRGRNAEGSNFPYEEARGVVLVGVPYADYSAPVVKAQIDYFDKKRRGLGEKWYVMDAFRAANQAMGRGIRHRDDWCNFILMDNRYETHRKLISNWAIANDVAR